MKARWALIFFAAGLGAGWLIFGGGMLESAEAARDKSAAPVVRKREARPVTSPHDSKFRSFAKELPKLDREDKEAFQKSLAPGDRPAAIDALLAQAGPDGISYEAKSMIGEILKTWAGEDFDGAWAWCRRIEIDDSRMFVASKLLDALVAKDPDRAFALHLEMVAQETGFNSTVPIEVLKQAASKDAASFLDRLGKLSYDPFAEQAHDEADFAVDFDFQQAADGVASLMKANYEAAPSVFPSNFLSTWASRDADAAYAWFSRNPRAPYEAFSSLLEGIEKQGVPGASHTWAAGKLSAAGTERDAMISSLTMFNLDRVPIDIDSIARAMPDTASRDRFLGDVVSLSVVQDPLRHFNYALDQISTSARRLETLQRLAEVRRLDAAKIPDAQLQQWGLTRQQVEQLQPPGR